MTSFFNSPENFGAGSSELGDLVSHSYSIQGAETLGATFSQFNLSPHDFMAVLDGDCLLGICSRREIGMILGSRFGWELFGKKLIRDHLEPACLRVREGTPVVDVLSTAFSAEDHCFFNDVILVDHHDCYVGMISVLTMIRLQHRYLLTLNLELEERVDYEVKKSRAKDQALIQSEKMASLGQLAAGVAHEINNPMAFISGNLRVLAKYYDRLTSYDRLLQESLPGETVVVSRASLDIDYILEDGTDLISESLGGVERVTKIVADLKGFSRVDGPEYVPVDLNSCLESALTVAHNGLKYTATVRKELTPLPKVLGNHGHLNQVFLNLLVNAGQAIEGQGEILLKSWSDEATVFIEVGDNGGGIPEDIQGRIFEPFFTTKEREQGTGLGLSISYDIVRKHGGEIVVESSVGKGTTFTVIIPRIPGEPEADGLI